MISGASALRAQKKSQLPSTRPLLPKRHNSLISRRWCELRGTWSNIQRKCGDNRKSVEAAVAKVDHIGRVLKSSMTALAVRIGAVRREQLLRREADAKAAVAGTGHDAAAVLRLLLRKVEAKAVFSAAGPAHDAAATTRPTKKRRIPRKSDARGGGRRHPTKKPIVRMEGVETTEAEQLTLARLHEAEPLTLARLWGSTKRQRVGYGR